MTQQKVRKHRTWLWVLELVLVMLLATALLYVKRLFPRHARGDGDRGHGHHP